MVDFGGLSDFACTTKKEGQERMLFWGHGELNDREGMFSGRVAIFSSLSVAESRPREARRTVERGVGSSVRVGGGRKDKRDTYLVLDGQIRLKIVDLEAVLFGVNRFPPKLECEVNSRPFWWKRRKETTGGPFNLQTAPEKIAVQLARLLQRIEPCD